MPTRTTLSYLYHMVRNMSARGVVEKFMKDKDVLLPAIEQAHFNFGQSPKYIFDVITAGLGTRFIPLDQDKGQGQQSGLGGMMGGGGAGAEGMMGGGGSGAGGGWESMFQGSKQPKGKAAEVAYFHLGAVADHYLAIMLGDRRTNDYARGLKPGTGWTGPPNNTGEGVYHTSKGPVLVATNVKPYEGSGSGAKSLGAAATGSQERNGRVVIGYVKKEKPEDPPSDPRGSSGGSSGGASGAAGGQSDDKEEPGKKNYPGHAVNVTYHNKEGMQHAKEDQQDPAGKVHTQYVAGEKDKDKWEHKEIGFHSMDISKDISSKAGNNHTVEAKESHSITAKKHTVNAANKISMTTSQGPISVIAKGKLALNSSEPTILNGGGPKILRHIVV